MTTQIRTTGAGTGEVLSVLGAPMVVKADGGQDGVFLADHTVPPGYAVPPHSHAQDDEFFWILEGEITLMGETGESKAGPGDFVSLPRGSTHGFRNDTARDARFLVLCRPGLQAGEMFRHLDRAARTMPSGLRPEDVPAICAQYGVTLHLPGA